MRARHNKHVKTKNWQLLSSLALVITVSIAAILLYLYLSNNTDADNFSSIESRAQNAQSDYVESGYVKSNHEQFEQKQAAEAARQGRSHIPIGSINDIQAVKPKPPKAIDAYQAPVDGFSQRLKERNQRQKEEQKPEVFASSSPELKPVQLSQSFKDALKSLSQQQSPAYDQQKIQAVTVTTADYYTEAMQAIQKPKRRVLTEKIIAGTTLYAIIVNRMNSDFPSTPVVAKIEVGKYRGAYLIGKFSTDNQWVSGVSITFDKLVYQEQEFAINALATNADYQPNLYDDINNHWFQRIGGLIVGSGLGGVKGLAKQYDGSNQNIILTDGGGSTQYGSKPDGKQLAIGFAGGAASDLSGQLEPTFKSLWNRPSTVTVNAGHAIGVLFVSTVDLTEKP